MGVSVSIEVNRLADIFAGRPVGLGSKPAKLMRGHAQEIAEATKEHVHG